VKKLLWLLVIPFLVACSNVPPGYTGIKVFLNGGDKGVDSQVLGVGRYWIGVNEDLFLFPTFTQNHVWTKASTEGSPNDDSFTFQTRQGLTVNTDVGISYHIEPDKVTDIFQKYRKGVSEITHVVLRNSVRDAFNKAASSRDIESVYGEGKSALIDDVTTLVRHDMDSVGIKIESIYLVGDMRLPESIVESINAKIQALQKTQQRENEVAQSKAEADKTIAEARGVAESKIAIAKAEAEAIEIKGAALRNNPSVLELNKIDKWNGELPQYMTGPVPMLNFTK
jgi:regulator of protease activity HflC (stomatin/prohibitin superfamily)